MLIIIMFDFYFYDGILFYDIIYMTSNDGQSENKAFVSTVWLVVVCEMRNQFSDSDDVTKSGTSTVDVHHCSLPIDQLSHQQYI